MRRTRALIPLGLRSSRLTKRSIAEPACIATAHPSHVRPAVHPGTQWFADNSSASVLLGAMTLVKLVVELRDGRLLGRTGFSSGTTHARANSDAGAVVR